MPRLPLVLCTLAAAVTACGEPTRPATITLSASVPALALVHGGTATLTVTVTRSNFAGPVQLAVDGLPAGVTAVFAPATLADGTTSSTLTLSAAAYAPTGTQAVTLRASGEGITAKTVPLAVQVSGAFTLERAAAALTVLQGDTVRSPVAIVRTGSFAGEVLLSVSGAPPGMSASIAAATPSDTQVALVLGTGPSTPAGTYVLTVHGAAGGVPDQAVTIAVTVAAVPSTAVTFGLCHPYLVWVGYQDSGGEWAPAVRTSEHAYAFTLTTARGAVAWVEKAAGSDAATMVEYGTAAELAAQGATRAADCALGAQPFDKAMEGDVSTVPAGHWGNVALGRASTFVQPGYSHFWLQGVPHGPRDLLATRSIQPNYTVDRMIVRRDVDAPSGSLLPLLDFEGTEAVTPVAATMTYTGYGDHIGQVSSVFRTANGSTAHMGYHAIFDYVTGEATYLGLPASHLRAGDRHSVEVALISRALTATFHEVADHTAAFGPLLAPAAVTAVSGSSPLRLRLELPVQPEYTTASVAFSGSNYVRLYMSAAYRGAAPSWGLAIPDFGAASGYDHAWGLRTGASYSWWLWAWGEVTSPGLHVLRSAHQQSANWPAVRGDPWTGARSRLR